MSSVSERPMKEKEFRQLEKLLALQGVHLFRAKGNADLDELSKCGYQILWSSTFGKNVSAGDCETIAMASTGPFAQPSQETVESARAFGMELVRREQAFFGRDEEATEQSFTVNDAYEQQVPDEESPPLGTLKS